MSHSHHEHDIARKVGHDLTHHHHHEAVQHLMNEFHNHDSKEFNHLLKNIQKSLHGHHDLSVERHNGKITHINFDHHDIYGGHAHDKKHSKDAERTGNTKDSGHSKHAEKTGESHDSKHSKHAEKSAETHHDPKHGKADHRHPHRETEKHDGKPGQKHEPAHPETPNPVDRRNAAVAAHDQSQLKDDTKRHREEHEKAKKNHEEEKPLTEQQQHVKGLLEKHLGHPIDRPQFEAYMDRAKRQHAERSGRKESGTD
jgi:hypothetical protein